MSSTITALTSGGGIALAGDTSGQLELKTNNGTTAVTVTTAQKVGVGISSPATELDVVGVGRFRRAADTTQYTEIDSGGGLSNITAVNGLSGVYQSLAFVSGNNAGNTERMRIDGSGNLCVGGTTANGKVSIFGDNSDWNINSNVSGGAATKYQIRFIDNGSLAGTITTAGTSTSYNTSSDYRLKENVAPMQNALANVSLLKPVTYKWITSGKYGQGFIAHELAEVVPDCVFGEKDAVDAEGNPVYQGIDTSFLVATLTAAIQELNAKVDAQAAEIQALKGVA